MVPSGATEKIPSDTTGNRSRDLSTLTTTLPQARCYMEMRLISASRDYANEPKNKTCPDIWAVQK